MEKYHLGIDVGSTTVKVVLIDEKEEIAFERYRRNDGAPLAVLLEELSSMEEAFHPSSISSTTVTGIGGKTLAPLLEAHLVNEVVAHATATTFFHPSARSIIEIGGEDAKFILLDRGPPGEPVISDFAMNTMCAAGTGIFLEQQAVRLGYTIEELGRVALKSKVPPRIAGRCTVFAKSDMVHLQQKAVPDYEIVAGLCLALARNLKSNILKGKRVPPPVVFQGGVAANPGVQKALKEVLGLKPGELIIPKHHATMGAIGAALIGKRRLKPTGYKGKERLQRHLTLKPTFKSLPPLKRTTPPSTLHYPKTIAGEEKLYLGVDVGSISTKLVLLNPKGELVDKVYLRTSGRPLEAIGEGLRILSQRLRGQVEVEGVGVTGSGRHFIGNFIGADLVRNEITAQATAAIAMDPEVDTIIEIGGQDSKFIRLKKGAILDFTMNKVCAAGTGSFLEEAAQRLGVDMQEFNRLALKASSPLQLGERCTVFMESDLLHHQQRGAAKEDLLAGLCYSIVYNYLNRVVEHRKIGERIFFQGATAYNEAVVAAFEEVLQKPVTVPPHHEVTGAIGVALLAIKEKNWQKSQFKGFKLGEVPPKIVSFQCKSCPNRCEIRMLKTKGDPPAFYGGRCEKYERQRRKDKEQLPNLLAERERLLMEWKREDQNYPRGDIGIPNILLFREWLPFFGTLLQELGFNVVVSPTTTPHLIRSGTEVCCAEACFPVKLAHGHILDLLNRGIKTIFLPQVVDFPSLRPELPPGMACPYVQAFPWMVPSSIDPSHRGARLLRPVFHLGEGGNLLKGELRAFARETGISLGQVKKAIRSAYEAQHRFWEKLKRRGEEILSSHPDIPICLLIGRPYNALDPGANLLVHEKLRELGALALPMDFLPLEDMEEYLPSLRDIYWHYGQKILAAGILCKRNPRLHPIYITNFACGPDSFILHLFKGILGEQPYLELEIDEHSGDAGIQTRVEAFMDSIRARPWREGRKEETSLPQKLQIIPKTKERRKIYLPPMSHHVEAVAASFMACGVEAQVLPPSDEESLRLGRQYTSGKECYPAVLTAGDMVKMTRRPDFDPKRSAFLMPSGTGPCRFGHYHKLHRLILDQLGYRDVPIYSPTQTYTLYQDLGIVGRDFTRLSWQGIVAVDILYKLLRETRPYCRDKKAADRLYQESLQTLCQAIIDRRDLKEPLFKAREEFEKLRGDGQRGKPIVGIVGEIYTRANPFANEGIVEELEDLGAEVWLAPLGEWILYINFTGKRKALWRKEWKHCLRLIIEHRIQVKDQHRFEEVVSGLLKNVPEPSTEDLLALASRYLHDAFEGEAVLSVGKALDYMRRRVDGVVNVIPFTCMPGTVVSAVFKRLKEENGYPLITVAYDGQKNATTHTTLEAFFHQVQCHKETKRGASS